MTVFENDIKVALSDDFLDALMQVPRTQRKKVQKFIRNFRRNPTSPGINFETIQNAADDNMRSVRVDQSYRAIILKPDQGNVYVLLWVDNHDDAYQWAERRRCVVHPETGSLQVFSVDEQEYVEPSEVEDEEEKKLFDEWRDRELSKLGVPDDLLPVVRKFRAMEDLDRAADRLPGDVYEALYFLADGESLDDVWRLIVLSDTAPEVDPDDFEKALENPQSQRKFVLVDDENLEEILEASLEKWRIFLHPMQRKIVELEVNGPIRVLGGAGTGKTVVAMHRAAYLAQQVFNGERDRILFTTFTKNLAADIEANLQKIVGSAEAMRRIEVIHLDQWVHHFLKRQGYPHEIQYFGSKKGDIDELWDNAVTLAPEDVDLPPTFYREEWEHVVQAQGCASLRDYLRARRTGRGVPLRRPDRKKVWRVFEEYRNALDDRGLRERTDAIRDARQILEQEGDILPYRAVLVDEAQDMGAEAFQLIRQMIPEERPNDLFIVGDGHQRIYNRSVVMKHCGINIVGRNRSHRLRINYRTTDEIRRFAVDLLEGLPIEDLDGGRDRQDHYKSLMHGEPPCVDKCTTFGDELDAIIAFLGDDTDGHASTCLVARTQKLLNQYADELTERGLTTYRVSRDRFDDRTEPGLRLATMHRVKGLEFDRVIVAGVNDGTVPLEHLLRSTEDEAVREDLETRERALFYVALTRAKTAALVTCHGEASRFLG